MKVCDKCKKELPFDFMQSPEPYFVIYKWSNMKNINIDLCPSCCKKLDKWLKNDLQNGICTSKNKDNPIMKCVYCKTLEEIEDEQSFN